MAGQGIYPIQYKAPDLSNIYKIAKNTGRNQGLVEALEGELDFRRDLYKKRVDEQAAAAKKRAAAAAASSDPDNESFWDKLDQFGKDIVDKQERALSWTLDKVQRPMYGTINALEEMNNQAYDENRGFFDMSGTGKVIDKFWKGFKGEEKKTFSNVIASEAAENPEENMWDNKWVQAGVGFVGDVAFDPLTYVGAGLVTKPLKAAKQAKQNNRLDDLARDIEKVGVKPGKEAEGFDHDVPLSFEEIRAMLGGGQIKSGKSTTAQRAEAMRITSQNLPKLKKWIRESPDVDTDSTLKTLDDEITKVQKARKKELSKTERTAYEAALKQAENNPGLYASKIPEGPMPQISVLEDWQKKVPLVTTAKAFQKEFFRRSSNKGESFDEVLGEGWLKDKRISPEFKKDAYDMTLAVARKDQRHRRLVRVQTAILQPQKRSLENKLTDARKDGNTKRVKELESTLENLKSKINRNYAKQHMAKAEIFSALVRNQLGDVGNMDPVLARELTTLVAERPTVVRDIERLNSQETGALMHGQELTENAVKTSHEGPDLVFNQKMELENRLKEIDRRLGELYNPDEFLPVRDKLTRPESLDESQDITEDWLDEVTDDPEIGNFKEQIKNEIEDRADERYEALIDTELRREREKAIDDLFDEIATGSNNQGTLFKPLKGHEGKNPIRVMFGNSKLKKIDELTASVGDLFKNPRIKIEGYNKHVYQADKDTLRKFVTKEDIETAAKSAVTKPESVKQAMSLLERIKGIEVRLLEGTTNTKGKLTELDDATIDALIERGKLPKNTTNELDELKAGTKNEFDEIELDVAEAARLARRLKDAKDDLKAIQTAGKTFTAPEHAAFDRLFKEQYGMTRATATRNKNRVIEQFRKRAPHLEKKRPTISNSRKAEIWKQAKSEATNGVNKQYKRGDLTVRTQKDLEFEAWDDDAFEALQDSMREQAKQDFAMEAAQAKATLKGRELESKLNALRQERDLKLALHKEAHDEAIKARQAMDERLDEQLLLDILQENVQNQGNFLKLTYAGINIGEFRSPVSLMEKMGHMPVIAQANAAWAKAFRPASSIEPELNLARLRAQAATPQIIKHHVDDIRHRFSKFKPEERRAAMKSLKSGVPVGNPALFKAMEEYFEEMMPYLTGKVGITDDAGNIIDALEIKDINQYLPARYKFVESKNINTVQDALKSMTNLPHTEDAMRVMWYLRVAQEQALSQKAFKHTIKSIYGVARPDKTVLRKIKKGEEVPEELIDQDKIVSSLGREHGWRTVGGLDDTHYFAPEVADDIDKLMEMMKPQNVNEIMQKYDKVIRAWKTTVTIYNPGYYVRNGIGEFMTGWFDNVSDPKWYFKAGQVIKYAMPDAMDDTLKQLEPWKKHQTINQKGARKITKKKYNVNGEMRELTVDDIWVLYNDVGLKSGFISSEFEHFFPAAGSVKSTQVGQKLTRANDRFKQGGEKYEDFFRIAHMINRMERSKLTDPLKAAEEASHFVRKYHFDYTDFTPFEKSAMLRLFPFYKWTRKAMPLMVSMAFTKPGKAFAYPKAMHALSVGTGANDPMTDDNGWLPNYEEVTPKWMQDMLSYPIGRDQEDAMTYMNVATPQMDVYKMFGDPVGTTAGMLTPGLKYPIEQLIGRPLDPEFAGMEMNGSEDRFDHTARLTPGTNLLNRLRGEGDPDKESSFGEPAFGMAGGIDEKLLSFLTGLGFYENSKARQQGEQMRRGGINQ